ncbi:GNAT family N-acetyltransferase [Bacillus sp. PS06]|uniref:GNAT family N-acetyltransferase n=1 Tax=Bacillus sp. PS06 TaxID=2764176 RepID=UPI0017850373|nr:GNAT family N-acetyltransferase [Bacillus sp. PS06]MBD8069819.1 GNAT family N-acetyltransferase [Bacillus sp. PS06]
MDPVEGFEIKMATIHDSMAIIKILKQIAQWMKDHDINQWRFLLAGGDDEEIEQAIINQETYIVLKDNDIVATFTLLSTQSEWDQHIWGKETSSTSLYIHRLAIIPPYMKKGLGKRLLNWIQDHASDYEYLRLDCVSENRKLNTFYKDNDFELIGVTDGHSKYQKRIKKN